MSSFDNIHVSFSPNVEVKEIPEEDKRVVICHSKDFSNEDLDILRENGKILRWSAHLANLDFENLEFDFLLMDLREKDARIQLSKQDLSRFHLVLFVYWFQKEDTFVGELKGHCLSSFPKRWVSKSDFLQQLISSKISSPSLLKSFLRLILACWKL